jgi:purine-binding chemotaxis protein CheW
VSTPSGATAEPDVGVAADGGAESSVGDVVVVRLAVVRYAVPMAAVAEVGRPPSLTRVPGTPSWVAGVGNWRGRILAVVDLAPLLDPRSAGDRPAGRCRLVVLTQRSLTVALLTDGVDGVLPSGQVVVPPPATLSGPASALLAGQLLDGSGPLGVIDPAAVFALRDTLPRPGAR